MVNDSKVLFYKSAAKEWLQAMPLGNGFLGAMVYGRTDSETIAINSEFKIELSPLKYITYGAESISFNLKG